MPPVEAVPYDAIIIGGGLAGLSLAIQLADAKKKVLVIEKNKYPFHRVCGEYVSMESRNFLERIGFPFKEFDLPVINELRVSSVNGNILTHNLNPGGFGISRYLLDHTLAKLAKERGAKVIEECRAEDMHKKGNEYVVATSSGSWSGKVIVGAFGKRSNIDKKMERSFAVRPQPPHKNWVGVKYHITTALPANVIELHNFDGGYCGISKVENNKYCLCYLTRADQLRKYDGSILKMEEQLLSQNKFLRYYFGERKNMLFETPETISQISFDNKLPVEKNVLMIGDAAGLIAPLCGNGMSMAFHAAAICFPLIMRFLSGEIIRAQMESMYSKQWRRNFAGRLSAGRMLQPLLVKSHLSRPAIAGLKHFPFVMKKIVKMTHGKSF